MKLARDGGEHFPRAAITALGALREACGSLEADRAGLRLHGIPAVQRFVESGGAVAALASRALGLGARAVRAVLFDKSKRMNWKLGWHQDRTICVKEKREVEGFGPWTVKSGLIHVAPPFALLERMVTMRVHLDEVYEDNAPLLVAPGSHRLGLVTADRIEPNVRALGQRACLAAAGDVWLYSTPILHASEVAIRPTRRRVLQIDFAAFDLPGGLAWLGV